MAASLDGQPERFPATRWSLVAQAGAGDLQTRREALEQLLTRYLPALRAHLVFRKRLAPEQADDLLQEFVASKILEHDLIARADRKLGKLRTLLLTALDRFVANSLRDERAQKRHPTDGAVVGFDEDIVPLPAGSQPADAFDLAWARGVIDQALQQMRRECGMSGRGQVWAVFECRVVGPILDGTPAVDYAELVQRFGFRSPIQAANTLITGKRMYARCLRSVIGEYADEEEIDDEINELKQTLARCQPSQGSKGL